MTPKKNPIEQYLRRFKQAMLGVETAIVEAGKIYVAALDDDAVDSSQFRLRCQQIWPSITPYVWRQFEDVGRGKKSQAELLGECPAAAKIRRLPDSVQKEIAAGKKFEVVAGGEVLKMDVRNLSRELARQIFDRDHIRSVAEQKAWMLEHCRLPESKTETVSFSLVGTGSKRRFKVYRPTEFTKQQLKGILLEF
jgi:hypothetical protein